MGRQQRNEDRQSRKRTKIASQSHASSAGSNSTVGKQTSNAGFVFNKNQFTSLVNKGKARQMQQLQHQQAAAQPRLGPNPANTNSMHTDLDAAEGSNAAVARLKQELAGAAASSNTEDIQDQAEMEDDAFFARARLQLDPTLTARRDSSIKAYMRELRKVVDNADVLLQVVDARDPLGCRSLETERMLLRAGKKIVLILNKIDLVPKANVEAWLKYLRHDFPTLAFKASTQSQRNNLSQGANANNYMRGDTIGGGSEAIGAGALLQLIKNYSRSLNMKTSIAVGVFGAPNVGKSSLINSLKRARVCSVASTPGHTKVVQSVMLDKSVRLLDCPGIVFSDESASGAAALGLSQEEIQIRRQSALLRNVVKVELVEDPITPVEAIMARVEPEHLMEVYALEWFQQGDAQDLLMRIAVQRGRMARGGKIDIDGTARSVLHDWNVGRIKYYTNPPALHRSAILSADAPPTDPSKKQATAPPVVAAENKKLEQSSAILSGFSEAFDLAALLGEADAEVFGSGTGQSNAPLPEARAPRYAALEKDEAEKEEAEIQDDHEQAPASPVSPAVDADTSRRSTLGKRTRSSSVSHSEDEDDLSSPRRALAVPGLDANDDTSDIEPDASRETPFSFTTSPTSAANSWTEKLAAKAAAPSKRTSELALAFSAEELSHMATSTGAQRRKLKKLKKRADRAGAGLVGQFEEQKLGEQAVGAQSAQGKGIGGGMFGNVAVQLKNKKDATVKLKNGKTGSMFDVLMEQQEIEDSEEEDGVEAEKVTGPSAAKASVAVDDDYEEEL